MEDASNALATWSFVIACVALVLSLVNFGWRIFEWRHAQRFEVRARVEQDYLVVGSGKYEVTVVVQNLGATDEAVQEVWLQYAEHEDEDAGDGLRLGPPSLRDPVGEPLPPRRNVRRTYDLLGARFMAFFPSSVTAIVLLESGKRIRSEPLDTPADGLKITGFPEPPDEAEGKAEGEAADDEQP